MIWLVSMYRHCLENRALDDMGKGAVVAEWLSSWLAEQEDRGLIPGLPT